MFSCKHYITLGNLWQKLVIQSSFVRLADFSSPRLNAGAPKPGFWWIHGKEGTEEVVAAVQDFLDLEKD
jgi:hypothetical protein